MEVAEQWRWFANEAAEATSPAYGRLARAVADDPAAVAFLESLDGPARMPMLLLAAFRWFGVDVFDPAAALAWLAAHEDDARAVVTTRRTQTNEVLRTATLLPALAQLPEPLALIEVGASAGLNLLYDRYSFRYGDHVVGSGLELSCAVEGPVPLPARIPEIAWQAGLDLNPLDAADPDTRRWLQCLVWPEHTDRAERLAAALELAAADPPRIVAGDMVDDLPALLAEAPAGATVVVLHSAALAYLPRERRAELRAVVAAAGAHRLGLEAGRVLPDLEVPATADEFVVSLDDRPLALGQQHGRSLRWL